MTSAEQTQIGIAVVGISAVLFSFVFGVIANLHINNEMIRQSRGLENPGKPETGREAKQNLSQYIQENPNGNLRKAQRTLRWSSALIWAILISFLLIIWQIMTNR